MHQQRHQHELKYCDQPIEAQFVIYPKTGALVALQFRSGHIHHYRTEG